MIRNLTVLGPVAIALTAVGVLGAEDAMANQFNGSVAPCQFTLKPDGPANTKTTHHVFLMRNKAGETGATTCNSISGVGTSSISSTKELTITGVAYEKCVNSGSGSESTFKMNGCDYLFTAEGKVSIKCPEGKEIEISTSTGCTSTIEPQGPLPGITYHDAGTKLEEITMSVLLKGVKAVLHGTKASCGMAVEEAEGEYSTGNTILTAETDPGGVMANVWWGQV